MNIWLLVTARFTDFKKEIMKTILFLILFALSVNTYAQSEVVTLFEAVKIKNEKRAEALYFYENNWKILRENALKKGIIHSFEFVIAKTDDKADFDLVLITRYKNQAQYEKSEENFQELIKARGELKLKNALKPNEFRENVFVKVGKSSVMKISQMAKPQKEIVMEGLLHPWSMAFLSENEALVAEKDGDLVRVNLLAKSKFVIKGFPNDLAGEVTIDNSKYPFATYPPSFDGRTGRFNAGIFEVISDPKFKSNNFIYVSYSAKNKDGMTTKVIRAVLKDDSLSEVKTILVATPFTPGSYHFGGGMTFGRDGKLYITVGERLFSEINQPPMPIAQDLKDRRGKIYRINSDGTIPEDNPDFGKDSVSGIYAVGIRAAQGITVEPQTGKIWFSEHGTNQGDEINLLKAGANYGWAIKTTGTYRYSDYRPPELKGVTFTDPVWYWLQTVAPTGLTFYTGDEFPEWKNNLFVSGLSRGSFWRFEIEGEIVKSVEELFVDDRVRSRKVVQSPEGKLYILTDEDNGKIIRIKNGN